MKLNKTEVQSLARQIRREALEKCNDAREVATNSDDVASMANFAISLFAQLPPAVYKAQCSRDWDFENLVREIVDAMDFGNGRVKQVEAIIDDINLQLKHFNNIEELKAAINPTI